MGLDMYLTAKRYLWYNEEDIKKKISFIFPGIPGSPREVEFEVCYWRKANHIHKWFVDHVQNGEDDCKHYYVSHEAIHDLVTVCETVLNERQQAASLLPTQSGFFFGDTSYDQYYFEDLQYTVDTLKPLCKKDACKGLDFQYHASW